MVCLACLLPLFLVPIVNILPLLFDFFVAKVYRILGWEYRKPERVPAACPYKPSSAKRTDDQVTEEPNPIVPDPAHHKTVGADNGKLD